jgi:hypothetical protein
MQVARATRHSSTALHPRLRHHHDDGTPEIPPPEKLFSRNKGVPLFTVIMGVMMTEPMLELDRSG